MIHFAFIEQTTGFVTGDVKADTVTNACVLIDSGFGIEGCRYFDTNHKENATFSVYKLDEEQADLLGDGYSMDDPEVKSLIESDCEFVQYLTRVR